MKHLIVLFFLSLNLSCCKEDFFNFTKMDNLGNFLGGDTTQGIMRQDAPLDDWVMDSVASIYLGLKSPKYRGCNGNIKVYLYPNPLPKNEKLNIKILSSEPVLSFSGAYDGIGINGGYTAGGQRTVINEIEGLRPIRDKTTYFIHVATSDSCVYRGTYNLLSE